MELVGFLLTIWLIFLGEIMLFKRYILKRLTYTCYFSTDEAYEGDEIELIETVVNNKWFPVTCLKSEITVDKYLDFPKAYTIGNDNLRAVPSLFKISGYQKITRKWTVKCLKRGDFKVEGTTIVVKDWLNFCMVGDTIRVDSKLTVLPRPINLASQVISVHSLTGEQVVKRFILEDPFYSTGAREYTSRDSINKIHWKQVARQQQLMVFQNECTADQKVTVILNMQSRPFEQGDVTQKDKMEEAIKICAGIFDETLPLGIPSCFVCNGKIIGSDEPIHTPMRWGKDAVYEYLILLAKLVLKSTDYFSTFLEQSNEVFVASDFIIVTCFLDQNIARWVRAKMREGNQVKIIVLGYEMDYSEYTDMDLYYCKEGETHERWIQ